LTALRDVSGSEAVSRRLARGAAVAPLDTLAQLGQKGLLLKRARARYLSLPLAVTLAELRSPLEKSYRNTVYCSATLNQEDGKMTGTYCGNRWCMVCNRIRTARAIQRYLPIVEQWDDSYLVTLTSRNVASAELPPQLRGYVKSFQAIKLGMRRTDGIKLVALRKLECTYNARTDEYHPHFHVVVKGEAAARLLHKRWLERYGDDADAKGQDVRRCDGDSLREVFKYFTKLLAKTRTAGSDTKRSAPVAPAALDVIFRSMKGLRVYQPVGFKVAADAPDEAADEIAPELATSAVSRAGERVTWQWSQQATDWVDGETGECLTGYEPIEAFRKLVTALEGPVSATATVRPLALEVTGELPADERTLRAHITERINAVARARAQYEPAFVSKTLQRIFDLTAERARAAALEVASDNEHQLSMMRELSPKVRELTKRQPFM
jgi:hypothetical protein